MPYQLNFQDVTVDGDTEIALGGTRDIRIMSAINTPRITGISSPGTDIVIAIQNLSGSAVALVHASGAASQANRKLLMSGNAGDWILRNGQTLRMLSVDPNIDPGSFADALRGWYVDNYGRGFQVDSSVHGAGSFTAARWTIHLVDLSGAAVTANIPAAAASNEGDEILIVQSVAGVAALNVTPSSGSIEGAATLALSGVASTPFLGVRLVSCGVGAGSPGWKVD